MKIQDPTAFFNLDISRSGLQAQRRRMDAISENIANVHTTRGANGGPFQPLVTTMREGELQQEYFDPEQREGVEILTTHPDHINSTEAGDYPESLHGVQAEIQTQNRKPRMEFDPDHPDADENGYVAYPDINLVEEMTHLIAASRAYEANLTAIQAAKEMAAKALEI